MNLLSKFIGKIIRPKGKVAFIQSLPKGAIFLDVGCGNDSPYKIKSLRSDLKYIGLDIEDYNQSHDVNSIADNMIYTSPENFAKSIENLENSVEAILSSHNIEHCNEYEPVMKAMAKALKINGRIYLSFPCEESVNFPSRGGVLNYFDDDTHQKIINFNRTIEILKENGLELTFSAKKYQPKILYFIGKIGEYWSKKNNKNLPQGATWAYYGFETVIWATKK